MIKHEWVTRASEAQYHQQNLKRTIASLGPFLHKRGIKDRIELSFTKEVRRCCVNNWIIIKYLNYINYFMLFIHFYAISLFLIFFDFCNFLIFIILFSCYFFDSFIRFLKQSRRVYILTQTRL